MESAEAQLATLGGGCFWCLEAVFEQLQGVTEIESGYSGGHVEAPTYEAVCSATTGHAEVVQVRFAAEQITYREILEVFFGVHDPTTRNRQGNDMGLNIGPPSLPMTMRSRRRQHPSSRN